MKSGVVASLLVAAVLLGAGAGYLYGSTNGRTLPVESVLTTFSTNTLTTTLTTTTISTTTWFGVNLTVTGTQVDTDPTCSLSSHSCTMMVSNDGFNDIYVTACKIETYTATNINDSYPFTLAHGTGELMVCKFKSAPNFPSGMTLGAAAIGTIVANGIDFAWAGTYTS